MSSVRELVRAIDWCECVVEESPANRGLGASILRGVSAVLAKYPSAIVYEDDLVQRPRHLSVFLTAALRHYANEPRVMSVTGWTHPRVTPADVGENPYFDGKGECWVWGTWARAWEGMDKPALDIMRERASAGIDIEKYGSDMPKMARQAGLMNLWAIGWWYNHMLHDCIFCSVRPGAWPNTSVGSQTEAQRLPRR